MAKEVKLADIAERLAVSTVTVSKALSGQKGVSEALRARIKELAEEMGYKQPSAQHRDKAGKSYNIGVLTGARYLDKYDSFYTQMYQQVAAMAAAKGCFTLLEIISDEAEEMAAEPMLIREQKADGIIVIGRLGDSYLENLLRAGRPVVYLDFCNEKQETDAVISDSYYGAYRLTNYLFEMGHRRIGYVGTLLATGSITDRYFGYVKSMLEHGAQLKDEWVVKDRDKETVLIDPERYLCLPKDMPTAFVCNSDLTASYLIRKLRENGYRVPEDISVAGYDNYLFPGLCDIALTTYEVDITEMARRAIHNVVKKIKGESYRTGICIVEGYLVKRDSVRDLRISFVNRENK